MDNKILPPDNFNDLVMNKIKNENISPSFSIYGVVFAVCGGFFAFVMAIDFNNLIPAFIMALGVYIVFYNLLFGVKKNG